MFLVRPHDSLTAKHTKNRLVNKCDKLFHIPMLFLVRKKLAQGNESKRTNIFRLFASEQRRVIRKETLRSRIERPREFLRFSMLACEANYLCGYTSNELEYNGPCLCLSLSLSLFFCCQCAPLIIRIYHICRSFLLLASFLWMYHFYPHYIVFFEFYIFFALFCIYCKYFL